MVFGLPAFQEIFLVSLALSLVMTLAAKFLTNQAELRKVKKDMEFYREKATKAQKAGDAKKANEYSSEMLKASSRQFRQSMKPMIFSLLIVVVAASWFGVNYGDVPLNFANNTNPLFTYQGVAHKAELIQEGNVSKVGVDLNLDGTISPGEIFIQGSTFSSGGMHWIVNVQGEQAVFSGVVANSPISIPLLGNALNWFWWYVLIVIPFSTVFRKLLDVV